MWYDVYASVEPSIPAKGRIGVGTGIAVKVPAGTYGRLASRSGLALRNKLDVAAGVIDRDYTGEIVVILRNHSEEDYHVTIGQRIAQIICEIIKTPDVEAVDSLQNTERGSDGFGSTGQGGNVGLAGAAQRSFNKDIRRMLQKFGHSRNGVNTIVASNPMISSAVGRAKLTRAAGKRLRVRGSRRRTGYEPAEMLSNTFVHNKPFEFTVPYSIVQQAWSLDKPASACAKFLCRSIEHAVCLSKAAALGCENTLLAVAKCEVLSECRDIVESRWQKLGTEERDKRQLWSSALGLVYFTAYRAMITAKRIKRPKLETGKHVSFVMDDTRCIHSSTVSWGWELEITKCLNIIGIAIAKALSGDEPWKSVAFQAFTVKVAADQLLREELLGHMSSTRTHAKLLQARAPKPETADKKMPPKASAQFTKTRAPQGVPGPEH